MATIVIVTSFLRYSGPDRDRSTQADQARTDFAAIEPDLEVIQKQPARLPTRQELAGTVLGIIFATITLTTPSLM